MKKEIESLGFTYHEVSDIFEKGRVRMFIDKEVSNKIYIFGGPVIKFSGVLKNKEELISQLKRCELWEN